MFEFLKKKEKIIPVMSEGIAQEIIYSHDKGDDQQLILEKKIKILEEENEHLKKSLLGIQADLAGSVGLSKEAVGNFKSNEESFTQIIDKSSEIESSAKSLGEMILKTDELVLLVNDKTSFVLDIVSKIEEIALQSKLLSFNASVEAARAGEAGKGFSVVALEVQKMSIQTTESLNLIKSGAEQILESSKSLTSSMTTTKDQTISIVENLKSFIEKLESAIEINHSSLKNVYSVNDRIFMSLAKIDHLVWKINTYLSFLKNEKTFDFVDHHNCRLGKWYESGEGKENFSRCQSYHEAEHPHSQVHQATKKIFEVIGDNVNIHEVEEAIDQMESASSNLFGILDQLLIQKK